MCGRASDLRFPKHFDGKRFYNPDAPQVRRTCLGSSEWKLTSRTEKSPNFIDDVEPSKPPRMVEGPGMRVTLEITRQRFFRSVG